MARRRNRKQDWTPREEVDPIWPKFLNQYLETAIWAGHDPETGRPLDQDYSVNDFAESAIEQAIAETNEFIKDNHEDLELVGNESQHGHDFFLTRNGHGAGFWDRGYGAVGKRLTAAAKRYDESDVYVGDDGKLYFA